MTDIEKAIKGLEIRTALLKNSDVSDWAVVKNMISAANELIKLLRTHCIINDTLDDD